MATETEKNYCREYFKALEESRRHYEKVEKEKQNYFRHGSKKNSTSDNTDPSVDNADHKPSIDLHPKHKRDGVGIALAVLTIVVIFFWVMIKVFG